MNGGINTYIKNTSCEGGDTQKSLHVKKHYKDNTGFYVYRFLDKNNNILYIGKTIRLRYRIYQHLTKASNVPTACIDQVEKVQYVQFTNECDMCITEIYLINYYKPKYNIDGKSQLGAIKIPIPNYWNDIDVTDDTNIPINYKKRNSRSVIKFDYGLFTNEPLRDFLEQHMNHVLTSADIEKLKTLCNHNCENVDDINRCIPYCLSNSQINQNDNEYVLVNKKQYGYGSISKRPNGTFEFKYTLEDGKRKSIYGKTRKDIANKFVEFQTGIWNGI